MSAKTAILIVEFAKQLHESEGLSIREATIKAAGLRFRAVLMTALSFVLGVLPLVLASGAGAASRVSLGMAVFAGMLASAIFGTLLVPACFAAIQKCACALRAWPRIRLRRQSRAGLAPTELSVIASGARSHQVKCNRERGSLPRSYWFALDQVGAVHVEDFSPVLVEHGVAVDGDAATRIAAGFALGRAFGGHMHRVAARRARFQRKSSQATPQIQRISPVISWSSCRQMARLCTPEATTSPKMLRLGLLRVHVEILRVITAGKIDDFLPR